MQLQNFATELRKAKPWINELRGHFVPGYAHGEGITGGIKES